MKFKAFMQADKVDFNRTKPGHPMHYDTDMNFSKDRRFWGALLMAMLGGWYAYNKFYIERLRWRRWEREGNIQNIPAHHVANHGGVVFKKQFHGFEKYYRNNEDLMNWYRRAYPRFFKAKE